MARCLRCKAGNEWIEGEVTPEESACICKGNWRKIVGQTEQYIGRNFEDRDGVLCRFFGIVHGEDDYYYGMHTINPHERPVRLLSCVGYITGKTGHDYALVGPKPKKRI